MGPVTSLTHTCTSFFTENGADVAIITNDAQGAQRFASNINDLREANSSFGRALAINCLFENKKQISEAIGQATEYFGGVESMIDFHIPTPNGDLKSDEAKKGFITQLESYINISTIISEVALDYITQRERGHLIYLIHNLCLYEPVKTTKFDFYSDHILELAQKLNKTSSVNCVSLGLTEGYLVNRFENKNIADALKKIKKERPLAKLVENTDIANHLAYISGGLSRGLNGQIININYGLCQ